MNKEEREHWEEHYAPYGKFGPAKANEAPKTMVQNGLFPEIKIEERIGAAKPKPEGKRVIRISHRKNFGIIQENIAENMDQGWKDNNRSCIKFCHKGSRWVYYGLMNTLQSMPNHSAVHLNQMPVSFYDVLNEAEIYAFLTSTWLGKLARDGDRNMPGLKELISTEAIERTRFEELLANAIMKGQDILSPHWYYDRIMENNKSNPYEDKYPNLIERLAIVPIADQSIVKEILKAKIIPPSMRTRSGDYTAGFNTRDVICLWKEDENGRHVKFRSLPIETRKKLGYFDDERRCASHVYDYFAGLNEKWSAWKQETGAE